MVRGCKNKNFFARNISVIIAFIIPIAALICIYAFKGIYPFGEEMYLRSDMYHQYATFLKEFQRILKGDGSLIYTWNIGLGTDLPGTYAYYLATPLYWLVALIPTDHIPEFMSALIILKAGLMSAFFTYYLQERTRKKNLLSAGFGIFYAMSSYMAAYSWNLMWLDGLVLFPLVILGLERLVKKKRTILYTVTLAITILSNYYIAIMICIYLVIYFIYLILCEQRTEVKNNFFRCLGRFSLYSVLAGLMASATIVPAFVNLSSTASGNISFPSTVKFYFNILEMISHSIMNVEPTVLKGYIPNIYCTVALFILVPLYMLSKKISLRVKTGKVALIIIFWFSFAMNILTYIWHGFHFPNSLSARQSFIYIFLVLSMGYEALLETERYTYREIAITSAVGIMSVYALQLLFDSEDYSIKLVTISAAFIALYFIWMMLKKAGRAPKALLVIALFVIIVGESVINTSVTGYSTTDRTAYMTDNYDYTCLLEEINDDEFYRVEKVKRRTKNDGAWLGYRSASEFSSTTLEGISDFYDFFGMQSSTNSFSYYGHTPLTSALLSVKYELSNEEVDDRLMSLIAQQNGYYLYENKYSLSLGFMVDSSVSDIATTGDNPFSMQNRFVSSAVGIENLFKIYSEKSGIYTTYAVQDTGRGYIYIKDKLDSAKVVISREGTVLSEETYSGLENQQIIYIGDVVTGDTVTVNSEDEEVESISLYPAVMDYDVLDEVMNTLGSNMLDITIMEDTYISGTIDAGDGGLMYTSVPYYSGWELYVDGVRTEYTSFKGAFITVELDGGVHDITLKYHSPSFAAAIVISIISIIIFILICLIKKYAGRQKVKKNRHAKCRISKIDSRSGLPAVTSGNHDKKPAEKKRADKKCTDSTKAMDNDTESAQSVENIQIHTPNKKNIPDNLSKELAKMGEDLSKISGELNDVDKGDLR